MRCLSAAAAPTDNPGEVVLRLLQLVDGDRLRAVQQSVAVVETGCYDTARDRVRHYIREQAAHVT